MLNSLCTIVLALTPCGEHPTAPDGRRGFGDELTIQETVNLLHSSEDEDQEFLARLFGLESEIAVRTLRTRLSYQKLGYFDLLQRTEEQTLIALHDAFFEQLPEARLALDETGEFPAAMARVWPDVAFVLRADLLLTLQRDVQELKGGRLFLLAHRDGYADVSDGEAQAITARMDLAAARLRAVILDFDLLIKSDSWVQTARELEAELGALALIKTASERMAAFDRIETRLKRNLGAARSILFTTRLDRKAEKLALARAWSVEEAEKYLVELLPWLPDARTDTPPSKELLALSKSKRYVSVLRHALTGLTIDPLNADLCYYAGLASDFLYGEIEAVKWYDRYLALRGMRAHESSTTKGRVMTEEERKAYDVVQRISFTPR